MLKSEEKPLTLLENPVKFIHTHTRTHILRLYFLNLNTILNLDI